MGAGGSLTGTSDYAGITRYFDQEVPELFTTRPEAEAFRLDFSSTDSERKATDKQKLPLSDVTIIDICLHPSQFTIDSNCYNLMKNIMIPSLANLASSTETTAYIYHLFQFVRRRDDFYREHRDKVTELALIAPDRQDDVEEIQATNFDRIFEKDSEFLKFVDKMGKIRQFGSAERSLSKETRRSIIDLLEGNKHDLNFVYQCFLFAINSADLPLLLHVANASFLIYISGESDKKKVKSVSLIDLFHTSIRAEYPVTFTQDRTRIDYIDYAGCVLPPAKRKCIFAAGRDSVFLLEDNNKLTKISLSKQISERAHRFSTIPTQDLNASSFIVTSGNYLIVGFGMAKNTSVFEMTSFTEIRSVEYYPKEAPPLAAPVTSDGKFVYAVNPKGIVNVYSVQEQDGGVLIVWHEHMKVELKKGPCALLPECPKILPRKIERHPLLSNGIVLEILMHIGNKGAEEYHYLIRTFSLADGQMVCDRIVGYPFLIHTWCYEGISNSIFVLSPYEAGVQIMKARNNSGQAPWMSNLNKSSYGSMALKVMNSTLVKQVFDVIRATITPFNGTYEKPQEAGDKAWEFASSGGIEIIETIQQIIGNFMMARHQGDEVFMEYRILLLEVLELAIMNYRGTLQQAQVDDILAVWRQMAVDRKLHDALVMFLVNCHDRLSMTPEYISEVFSCAFENMSPVHWGIVSERMSKLHLFPFLMSSQCIAGFYSTKLRNLRRSREYDPAEMDFMMDYQASMMKYLEYRMTSSNDKFDVIIGLADTLCKTMTQQMTYLLTEITDVSEQNLKSNKFIALFRQFLIILHPIIDDVQCATGVMKHMIPLMASFSEAEKRLKIGNEMSHFHAAFSESFVVTVSCLISILRGGDELKEMKRFQILAKTAMKHMESGGGNWKAECRKTFTELLSNHEYKDLPGASELAAYCYTKVQNPFNRRMPAKDKELEGAMVFAMCWHIKCTDELMTLFRNRDAPATPTIKQVIQSVYKIRGDLRSSKQATQSYEGDDANRTMIQQYDKYYQAIEEKCKFLICIPSVIGEISIKQLTQFISSDKTLDEFMQLIGSISIVRSNTMNVIRLFTDVLHIKNFPEMYYMHLLHSFTISNTFSDTVNVLNEFTDSLDDIQFGIADMVSKANALIVCLPPYTIVAFAASMIFTLARMHSPGAQTTQKSVANALSSTIKALNLNSGKFDEETYHSCLAFLCYVIRTIKDEFGVELDRDKMRFILAETEAVPMNYCMSFSMSHALLHAGFEVPFDLEEIVALTLNISGPEFHSFCLYAYEVLIRANSREDVEDGLSVLIDAAGQILIGGDGMIMQDALSMSSLTEFKNEKFCRTPEMQINTCLEIIILLRKILLSNSLVGEILYELFASILRSDVCVNRTSVIRTIVAFNVMANAIDSIRPGSIVRNVTENKKIYVTSINYRKREFHGITLPLTADYVVQKFSLDEVLEPCELVPFRASMFQDRSLLLNILRRYSCYKGQRYADRLLCFYAMNCLRTFVSDSDDGADFTKSFLAEMRSLPVSALVLAETKNKVVELLKRSLTSGGGDIFVGSPIKPKFYHTSLTPIVLNNSYKLTDRTIEVRDGSHVFLSSILDDQYPVFLAVEIGNMSGLEFGLVTHSVYQNQTTTVTYSVADKNISINGEVFHNYKAENELFEMKYDPIKAKISFASSKETRGRICSIRLTKDICSFFICARAGTRLNYSCGLEATTDVMRKVMKISDILHPKKLARKVKLAVFGTKIPTEMEQRHTKKFTMLNVDNTQTVASSIDKYCVPQTCPNARDILRVEKIPVMTTSVAVARPAAEFLTCTKVATILDSPMRLPYYFDVSKGDGSFEAIPADKVQMVENFTRPPLHYENFVHLPSEILNCCFSGICELHRRETISRIMTMAISDPSTPVGDTMKFFSMSQRAMLDFVVQTLVLCEPLVFANIKEGKCPIDFEVNTMLPTYVCSRSDFFDQHSAMMLMMNHIRENQELFKSFTQIWWKELCDRFDNVYSHFVSLDNTEVIVVDSAVKNRPKVWNRIDTTGWIIFPIQLGLRKLPGHNVVPSVASGSPGIPFTYGYVEGDSISMMLPQSESSPWAILPVSSVTNAGLTKSFIETAIDFKYFTLFVKNHAELYDEKTLSKFRLGLREFIRKAIVFGSPFFYSHDTTVLAFLDTTHPLKTMDLTDNYKADVTKFAQFAENIPHAQLREMVEEQLDAIEVRDILQYRSFFPEFSDPNDVIPPPQPDAIMRLPNRLIESVVSSESASSKRLFTKIKKLLIPRKSLVNFPFYLILNDWATAFVTFPSTEIKIENNNTIKIRFIGFVPDEVKILDRDSDTLMNTTIDVSYHPDFSRSSKHRLDSQIPTGGSLMFIRFSNTENISEHKFVVMNPSVSNVHEIARRFRDQFVSDMTEMILHWSKRDDQMIMVQFPADRYNSQNIHPHMDPIEFAKMEINSPIHLISLRSQLLIVFNFLNIKYPGSNVTMFKPFMSLLLSVQRFNDSVMRKSATEMAYLKINRRHGLEVRSGVSNNLESSMISQFASSYTPKTLRKYRNVERPFHVEYKGENGIDVGGLARDFASELVKDISEPKVGLFIKTPNGRNRVGSHRECLIPCISDHLKNPQSKYVAIGGLLAIGIRVKLTQPYNFPPVFWEYLAGGSITVDSIYEIDDNYRQTMTSLADAMTSGMTPSEFDATFHRESVVVDIRGRSIPIGRGNRVTHANCLRYIAQCHEYRIAELERPLKWIRDGFWENLDFRIPEYTTGELLEFLACGARTIDVKQLKERTRFEGVPNRHIEWFWIVVGRLTNEQRRLLLQFSTGTMSIPHGTESFLKVDYISCRPDSRLPTASTCFYRLHIPTFSSVDMMQRMIITACENTGSFENS